MSAEKPLCKFCGQPKEARHACARPTANAEKPLSDRDSLTVLRDAVDAQKDWPEWRRVELKRVLDAERFFEGDERVIDQTIGELLIVNARFKAEVDRLKARELKLVEVLSRVRNESDDPWARLWAAEVTQIVPADELRAAIEENDDGK